MAGILIPFLPMTRFDFSFLANNSEKTIVLNPALDVRGYYYARLIVRVHEIDNSGTTGNPHIEIGGTGRVPSSEDPGYFVSAVNTLAVDIDSSHSAGSLVSDTDTDLYPFLGMYAKGSQGNSSGARLFAVLSADLLLREA